MEGEYKNVPQSEVWETIKGDLEGKTFTFTLNSAGTVDISWTQS